MSTYLYEVLDRLVAFDTVSVNSDVPAIEYLAGHFERAGFTTSLHRIDVGGVAHANLVAWAGPPREGGLDRKSVVEGNSVDERGRRMI